MSDEFWLQEWLEELNLIDYQTLLIENGLTSKNVLMNVEKTQLKDYGVTKPGHLNRLHKAILKLRGDVHVNGDGDSSNTSSSSDLIGSNPTLSTSDTMPLDNQNSVVDGPPPSLTDPTAGVAPPVPRRRSLRRYSPVHRHTVGGTEDMLTSRQLEEESPLEEPPVSVPKRIHSLRRKSSTSEFTLLKEADEDPVGYNKTSGVEMASSSVRETSPDNSLGSQTKSPQRRRYENVGKSAGVAKQPIHKAPPPPPPRVSSLDSDDSPPPIIPPQRSPKVECKPYQAPLVTSYSDILEGEVWSEPSSSNTHNPISETTSQQPPPLQVNSFSTGDNNTYEMITDMVLPPPINDSNLYEPIGPATNDTPATNTAGNGGSEPTFDLLPTMGNPDPSTDHHNPTFDFSLPDPPEMDIITNEALPLPPELPPKSSVPDFTPPPPQTLKPAVPTRTSSLPVGAESIDFQSPPPLPHPPVSSPPPLPPPPVSSPSNASSPTPFSPSPPPILEEESIPSPVPPPIPKRNSLKLPPPPPPPITTEDYPENEQWGLGSGLDYSKRELSSGSLSDDQMSSSCTPGSPLTPCSSSTKIIQQLESGSDSIIGITPPSGSPKLGVSSDSDDESSSHLSFNSESSTLKSTLAKSSLEPLHEDTMLASADSTYETIAPPKPLPRTRPKSTFVEEKMV